MTDNNALPKLIAHRGERADYPENTLSAIGAALDAGADGVEFDIQFAGDGLPVVVHDRDLQRTGDDPTTIDRTDARAVAAGLPAHEPRRFGQAFTGETVPTFESMVAAIVAHRDNHALVFAEIKHEGLAASALQAGVSRVLEIAAPLGDRLVVIAFDIGVLRCARALGAERIGWVVNPTDAAQHEQALSLEPAFLFADRVNVMADSGVLWPGQWRWIVYEVNARDEAERLSRAGVWAVETASIAAWRKGPHHN